MLSATCRPRQVAGGPCGSGTAALAVEQGYQQMKEELGLDHFEGRSWHGFHRHATLVMLAYGFLTFERLRAQAALAPDGRSQKKKRGPAAEAPEPRLTLPAVRRALQRLLRPACHPRCRYCRTHTVRII